MLSDLITRGGPVMYALFACSLLAVTITLERAWFWLSEKRKTGRRKLSCLLAEGREGGEGILRNNAFLENIVSLQRQGKASQLKRLLRRESERAYERSTKYLSGLDTIVSIAPLLGILGTVLGIMKAFHALDLKHMASPGEVSHGLAEAMLTTATGLTIAVPTLIFYNIFHSLAAGHAAALYKLSEDISDELPEEVDELTV